jgi:hypothetical protein
MSEATDRQLAVLLGASNLTLGWPHLLRALKHGIKESVDVFTANGMGRSYLRHSRFAWRTLPGILESDLWSQLQQHIEQTRSDKPPVALITDLGNDMVYGRSPQEVVAAAEQCIQRLKACDERVEIVITRPPVQSVTRLSWLRYHFFRTVLFPACDIKLTRMQQLTQELDEGIRDLAEQYGVIHTEPLAEWYGLDPIHIRRRNRFDAFCGMTRHWQAWTAQPADGNVTSSQALPVRRPIPFHRLVWSRIRNHPQPSVQSEAVRIFAH